MRSPLVVTSVGIHVAVVSGLLVAGLWKLDRLDPGRATFDLAVASPPPAAASGSPATAKAEPFKRKKPQRVVKDIVQPQKRDTEATTQTTATEPSDGTGGSGSGAGSGSGFDPIGTGTCAIPPCGTGSAAPVPTKPTTEPIVVPPTVIKGLRTSGETQIHPPAPVKTTMLRDGASKVIATLRLCVGTDGEVSSVSVLKSSGYAGYDAALDEGLRRWRYRSYMVDGRKVPVCGVVTFVYSIK